MNTSTPTTMCGGDGGPTHMSLRTGNETFDLKRPAKDLPIVSLSFSLDICNLAKFISDFNID